MLKINTENSSLIISTEEKKRAEDQATILIQKIVRGFLANRQCVKTREEVISSAQFESAKEMIKTGSYLYFPRASSGITKVYFPTDLPFVLKASGLDKGYVRIQQMKQAFNYCKQKKFSALFVPRAILHGIFIIEERIPIPMDCHLQQQIGLYLENLSLFEQVAKELVLFLSENRLYDLDSGKQSDPYASLCPYPPLRYDNVTLFIEEKKDGSATMGKIALVDLEKYSKLLRKVTKQDFLRGCYIALRFFPHHFETMCAASQELGIVLTEQEKEGLMVVKNRMIDYFHLIYQKHKDFLIDRQIGLENAASFAEISNFRQQQIKDLIKPQVCEWLQACYERSLAEVECFFDAHFSLFFQAAVELIVSHLNKAEFVPTSTLQLLQMRTITHQSLTIPLFSRKFTNGKICHLPIEGSEKYFNLIRSSSDATVASPFQFENVEEFQNFASFILEQIYMQFKEGGEIADFLPSVGDEYQKKCYLFV